MTSGKLIGAGCGVGWDVARWGIDWEGGGGTETDHSLPPG